MHFSVTRFLASAILMMVISQIRSQTINEKPKTKYNIILFVADDLGARDLAIYGNKIVKTPNLDRLAESSMVFTRAYASSPTCAPSRASIHTGLYPFRDGAHANHTGLKDSVKTLPYYLNPTGYRCAIAGKLHIGPLNLYPYEMILHTNIPEPGHEGQGVLWTDLNMNPVDTWLSKAADKQKPFVLVINDHSPHVNWPEKATYDPSEVDIPSILIDTEPTRQSRARYYTDITKMDGNLGKLMESLKKYHLNEQTIIIFTSDQGPQWAFGKWNLYEYGIRVPLIIQWPDKIKKLAKSDALVSLTDLMPTILEMTEGKPPRDIDGSSIMPLLTGSNRPIHDTIFASHTGDGTVNQSPMRMICTKRYKYIFNLVSENTFHTHIDKYPENNTYWPSWLEMSFRDQHAAAVLWRYFHRPEEELYDLQTDPEELHNLAADPAYKAMVSGFRSTMRCWRQKQGDVETGVFTEPPHDDKNPVAPYIF